AGTRNGPGTSSDAHDGSCSRISARSVDRMVRPSWSSSDAPASGTGPPAGDGAGAGTASVGGQVRNDSAVATTPDGSVCSSTSGSAAGAGAPSTGTRPTVVGSSHTTASRTSVAGSSVAGS